MRPSIAALAALVLLACLPAGAGAANDPLGSGTTKLVLDKRFVSFLRKDGVTLTAKAGAKRRGNTISLPVSGGSVDQTIGKGEIDQEGTLVFQSSRERVPLRSLVVKTKHSPLIAKVGGSQLKIATAGGLSSKRSGFGTGFEASSLKLTGKVVTRLNKKLRPPVPFAEKQPLGRLSSDAQPQLVTILAVNKATYAPAPAFFAKLHELFVSVNPISPAELAPGPLFYLPIVPGGSIAPDASAGTLRTGGSLELLQLGGGQVFWHEFWLDLGAGLDTAEPNIQPSPPYPGKGARGAVFDASIAAASVSSDPKARTISVSGVPLVLDPQTAATLNEVFTPKKEVFKAGESAGSLSFVAQGQ